MPTPIPPVSPDELIRASWGQAVATEVNGNCLKKDVASQAMTGPLIITGGAVKLRSSVNTPQLWFESTAATPVLYAHIVADSTGKLYFHSDVAGGLFLWYVDGTQIAYLDATGKLFLDGGINAGGALTVAGGITATGGFTGGGAIDITGFNIAARAATLARNDNAQQLNLVDFSGSTSGGAAHALINFYTDATSATSLGTLYGFVGVNGNGMQISTVSNLVLSGDAVYIGKTAADADTVGTEIYTNAHPTAAFRGQINNTVGTVSTPNVYLRHVSGADVNGQLFVDFTRATGTRIGSITQATTGDTVRFNGTSDYRLKNDLGPIPDAAGKVAALAPKVLEWKETPGQPFAGFIAHEVAEVVPYAVTGAKDAVLPPDDPHNPGGVDPQQLDQTSLIPLLTAALQDALVKIDDLTARIAALEGATP